MTKRSFSEAEVNAGRTVGVVAQLVGVTVRALHHWDAIGLVRPSERTDSGYRFYTAADLARIHRVLLYRELGVPLTEIGALLDAPAADGADALRRQRDQLRERIARLQRMGGALDRMIEARESGILLSAEEQVAIFGEHWQPSWVGEARKRWGDTPQWTQYAERAAHRTAEDWQEIAGAVEALNAELAAAHRAGVVPGSERANALAERHRASIGVYFDCTHAMQVCLGRTYATDPEYVAFYDTIEPGLSTWLHHIIDANARKNGIDPETATWV
ncbi:MerR family transcriptional regulator [Nocardia donostiensis]|uniref:MerR family transcriptional regulator n=1 Tax=Nocardia donostiensis TaxID=1538463 RepID=A0A1V2TFC2_9NOCA|nr:MerR family transcriptional regulator [Nocardia donostiensis]ONM48210.1 MerR family transcriptional regulator [Nocardia donostiensis]OQS13995.1 MerR family transcriptional regulator [Nocardia donostiensis]OQS20393.1 MerR family transcriptional regulator [Nocardia donostiensis]